MPKLELDRLYPITSALWISLAKRELPGWEGRREAPKDRVRLIIFHEMAQRYDGVHVQAAQGSAGVGQPASPDSAPGLQHACTSFGDLQEQLKSQSL